MRLAGRFLDLGIEFGAHEEYRTTLTTGTSAPMGALSLRKEDAQMAGNQSLQGLRDAIGRGLSTYLAVDRNTPERLKILLRRLELAEEEVSDAERTRKRTQNDQSS